MKAWGEIKSFFRIVRILFVANMKQQTKERWGLFFAILTPIVYTAIYIFLAIVSFNLNQNNFSGITKERWILAIFIDQIIYFTGLISAQSSVKNLAQRVKTSKVDIDLLRPLKFSILKYFSIFSLGMVLLVPVYLISLIFIFKFSGIFLFVKVLLFIIFGTVIRVNLNSIIHGFQFFVRDVYSLDISYRALGNVFIGKPPEVFTNTIFVVFLPIFIFHTFLFDLLRNRGNLSFWVVVFLVLIFSSVLNNLIWKKGLKKYESMG